MEQQTTSQRLYVLYAFPFLRQYLKLIIRLFFLCLCHSTTHKNQWHFLAKAKPTHSCFNFLPSGFFLQIISPNHLHYAVILLFVKYSSASDWSSHSIKCFSVPQGEKYEFLILYVLEYCESTMKIFDFPSFHQKRWKIPAFFLLSFLTLP